MNTLTSSMIVTKALGFKPDGIPAPHDGNCAFCGLEIKKGDPYVKFRVGPAFMDEHSFAVKGSGMTCGYCVHLCSSSVMIDCAYGAFNLDGVRPFRKWRDIANALYEPPEPPFVMTYATANNQHMAWRAPVNLSRDLFYVRVGLRDLKIRRPILLKAVEICQKLGEAIGRKATTKTPKGGKTYTVTLPHPFIHLSNDLKKINHGQLDRKLFKPEHRDLIQDINFIHGLTLGETWALLFLLTPGAGMAAA